MTVNRDEKQNDDEIYELYELRTLHTRLQQAVVTHR